MLWSVLPLGLQVDASQNGFRRIVSRHDRQTKRLSARSWLLGCVARGALGCGSLAILFSVGSCFYVVWSDGTVTLCPLASIAVPEALARAKQVYTVETLMQRIRRADLLASLTGLNKA